jgi:RNA polymerase sigma-70 factor (ECF subfamily)
MPGVMESQSTRLSLIARVRDPQDALAWGAFERRYADLVLRYALARGLQFADAEDVRQVVFLRLARCLRTFEYAPARGRFRSYLGAIVRNVIFEQAHRPRAACGAVDEMEDALAALPDPRAAEADERWEREWADHHCRLALQTIRETFDARSVSVFEDLLAGAAPEEAAARHGLSGDAVAKIRQRVRARMQELIRAQLRDEEGE